MRIFRFSILARRGGACPAHRATSASFIPNAAMSVPRRASSPSVIPNEAGRFFLPVPVGPRRSACECEESLLWFVLWFRRGRGCLRSWLRTLWSHGLPDSQVFAHFVEAFLSEPADGQPIIDALECAIRLAHLQNLDPGHLLQFFGIRSVDVHRLQRRLLLRRSCCRREKKDQAKRKENLQNLRPQRHGAYYPPLTYLNQ